jgi:Fe2+ transport system protein FeoA
MKQKRELLTHLPINKKARIISLEGGQGFQRKLRVMGIREGQTTTIISKQPFRGPITVKIGNCQTTLGRGMTHKIIVEEL